MAYVLSLRDDYTGDDLRGLARSTDSAKQARRLLALSLIYDGSPRSEAARHGGVGVQTVRDWVLRFNASGADGLLDRTASRPGPGSHEGIKKTSPPEWRKSATASRQTRI